MYSSSKVKDFKIECHAYSEAHVSRFQNGRGLPRMKSWSQASIGRPKKVVGVHILTVLDINGSRKTIFKHSFFYHLSSTSVKVELPSMVVQTGSGRKGDN